ncbi:hypothetical protein ACFVWR_06990 [Leifsonia sp. NPDC058292]|uniref:hypothetical protein n=1 Tax=Leifsonia sp. NPDC058292 TaxID=3346428 RepID=UPI0036DAE691
MTVLLVAVCVWSVGPATRGTFETRDWFWFGGLALLLLVNIGLSVWLTRNLLRRWRQQNPLPADGGEDG